MTSKGYSIISHFEGYEFSVFAATSIFHRPVANSNEKLLWKAEE